MAKKNCWEFKRCGREPGGVYVADMGVCPAAAPDPKLNGLNNGKDGGRICWAIAGTYCGDKIQGRFAQGKDSCLKCNFYKLVKSEEANNFHLTIPGKSCKPATK